MARYLITSALPYINGVKHLGNLAGSMLPACVQARFRRLQGHEVLYICATDEHGTPAELAAAEADMPVADYCARQHEIQKRAGADFDLSFDWFGRTSDPENHALTQHFAARLRAAGLIEERATRQVYSIDDARFLPDRYVEGTCPHCGYERARGDQCDNCSRLLDPAELIAPYSAISKSRKIEIRETNHLFLRQTALQSAIRAWVDAAENWPSLARSIAYKWLDEGLQDRSITRDLSWGVPVADESGPLPGYERKVFYVWFDAPIGYIAATQSWASAKGTDWRRWWRRDQGAEDVTYVQFMGKDNVAFHTVSFPATILGSGEPWVMVDRLKAFNWVTWYGGKFSTSQKRGVFMDQAIALAPSDCWRWHLMAQAPEGADAAFTWELFQTSVNKDLADVLGNFVNRVLRFAQTRFDARVPAAGPATAAETTLFEKLTRALAEASAAHEAMEFRKAAAATRAMWVAGNEYLQEAAPWTAIKTDPERAGAIVHVAIQLVGLFAAISAPFIPRIAAQMAQAIGLSPENLAWPVSPNQIYVEPGAAFAPPDVLVKKIEDADIAAWTAEFGGG